MLSLGQLQDVCRRMNDKGVRYVVIGGWAIYLHGYERATRDIDLLVDASDDNVARIKAALHDLLPEACGELHSSDVQHNAVVRMAGEELVVDLIRSVGDLDFTSLSGRVLKEMIGDVCIPVADLDAMLELKGGVRDVDRRDYLFLKGKKEFLSKKK